MKTIDEMMKKTLKNYAIGYNSSRTIMEKREVDNSARSFIEEVFINDASNVLRYTKYYLELKED